MSKGYCEPPIAVETGAIYRHYKGNLYYVMNFAEDAGTGELLVIYHSLTTGECFARTLAEFTEEVNINGQKCRFEKVIIGGKISEKDC